MGTYAWLCFIAMRQDLYEISAQPVSLLAHISSLEVSHDLEAYQSNVCSLSYFPATCTVRHGVPVFIILVKYEVY
jgi:hypothetical protein